MAYSSESFMKSREEAEKIREEETKRRERYNNVKKTFERMVGRSVSKEELTIMSFSDDADLAFEASIESARLSGVSENKILKSLEDVDKFFLGEN